MKPTTSTRWLPLKLKRRIIAIRINGIEPAHLLRVSVALTDPAVALLDTSGDAGMTAGELLALQAAKHQADGLAVVMRDIDPNDKHEFAQELRVDLWVAPEGMASPERIENSLILAVQ